MMTTLTSTAIDALNELLGVSLAASKTYTMAIGKIESNRDHSAIALRVMQRQHDKNARSLSAEIRRLGGDPHPSAGAWSVFAQATEAVASLFGVESAVRALKESEEHGLHLARKALPELEGAPLVLVRSVMIPGFEWNIELLDSLTKAA